MIQKSTRKHNSKKENETDELRNTNNKSFNKWFKDKFPVIKFFLLFSFFVSLYYISIQVKIVDSILVAYTHLNVKIASFILNILGESSIANGFLLSSHRFSVMIGVGCEGSEPIVLFLSALFAFPMSIKLKIPGLLIGTGTLFLLNMIRIVGLFYSGVYYPKIFEMLHSEIFPIIFIFIAIILWIFWIKWALKKSKIKVS